MRFIYDISIHIYSLFVYTASFFNKKAKLFKKGRASIFHFLKQQIKQNPGDYIWFHCASLGEFEQGRPLIESIKNRFPKYKIIVSFFSPSGYEVRKKYEQADIVCYLPFDTVSNAQKFIDIVNPKVVFFIKYEFWHHFLFTLKTKNIPTYLVSGIFRKSQIQFKSYGGFFLDTLKNFKHFFIQDEKSSTILLDHGLSNHHITGDTRFDRVAQVINEKKEIDYIERFSNKSTVIVYGSTWPADEHIIAPIINSKAALKHIIAPHEITETHLKSIETLLHKPFIRYSEIRATTHIENFQIIIIDSIGILSHLYRYGHYAYVGGGFGKGLHNILEAATFGIPIFFGPNYEKFNEAKELIHLKGAFSITNSNALNSVLENFQSNPQKKKACDEINKSYVQSKRGATQKILNYCIEQGDL